MSRSMSGSGTDRPSTWSITHVPDGTEIRCHVDTDDESSEIRVVFGEPELAELAIGRDAAMVLSDKLESAVRACPPKGGQGEA